MSVPPTPPRDSCPRQGRFSPQFLSPTLAGALSRLLLLATVLTSNACYVPLLWLMFPPQCDTVGGREEPISEPIDEATETPSAIVSGDTPIGSYAYEPLALSNLGMLVRATYHANGDAVLLEVYDVVHVLRRDGQDQRFEPAASGTLWTDAAFAPSGDYALLTGRRGQGAVLIRFEYARWRAGESVVSRLFTSLAPGAVDEPLWGVTFPASGNPIVLSGPEQPPYWARLRELDNITAVFSGLHAVQFTTAGCTDVAFVGGATLLVTCGLNGGDYHTWQDGWTARPGGAAPGNLGRIATHPYRSAALVTGWAGNRIYRFGSGTMESEASALAVSPHSPWGAAFASSGERALIVGDVSSGRGTILEYRTGHDHCPLFPTDCELNDVSAVGLPALSQGTFYDVAFRHDCDSGIIVGGYSHLSGTTGYALRFAQLNGRACSP